MTFSFGAFEFRIRFEWEWPHTDLYVNKETDEPILVATVIGPIVFVRNFIHGDENE